MKQFNYNFPQWVMVFLLLVITGTAVAQPTLTRDKSFFKVGDFYPAMFCNAQGVTQGESGANVTWDFSEVLVDGPGATPTYIDPKNTDFPDDFPTANVASASTTDYGYFEATNDGAFDVGFGQFDNPGTTNADETLLFTYLDNLQLYKFPFDYQNEFTDTMSRTYTINNGAILIESGTSRTVKYDGWGTLILPTGTFNNVARLRIDQVRHDEAPDDPNNIFLDQQVIRYEWFSLDLRSPILSLQFFEQNNGGQQTSETTAYFIARNDEYGYTYQLANDGINSPWIDITTKGTEVKGLADDNFVGPVNMGIDFQYYWSTMNSLYIASNGYVAFDAIQISSGANPTFNPIPTENEQNNYIAPLLCDLTLSSVNQPGVPKNPGKVYTWSNNIDTFIVSYENVPFWTDNQPQYTGSNTFQVIFSAKDTSITFNYKETSSKLADEYLYRNVPMVVGLENSSGKIGLGMTYSAPPPSGACVIFNAPTKALVNIKDVYPAYLQNTESQGTFVLKGDEIKLKAAVKNGGNVAIPAADFVIINAQVYDENGDAYYSDPPAAIITSGLTVGEVQTKEFTAPDDAFIAVAPGWYSYEVSVNANDDINPGNNTKKAEIVVVDSTANGEIPLSFTAGDESTETLVSWTGSTGYDEGAGMFIVPPFYACEIVGVEYFVVPESGASSITAGFRGQILANDNGKPGAVLAEKDMAADAITPIAWNRIDFETPVTVYAKDGGFFVSWLMETTGIGLATDELEESPVSRTSFEILSGAWAPYRQRFNSDLYIRVIVKKGLSDGINQPINNSVVSEAYPNPAPEAVSLNYTLQQNTNLTISVTNSNGQVVKTQTYANAGAGNYTWQMPTANLTQGLYQVSFQLTDGTKVNRGFVVTK
ncbi:MAG: T9SS type A sorting domain-containing protein [Sphingobacteriales bacterium]|jgi:hypothetical protein|nr:T9SS type A sorting domain-containing protein [Sphingobacteriales bacterium]MBP9141638.1 T9SS type A sorting domain-containing protein [Chitinophagales bacterium]MDA0198824.1 T9SS type A sorting domain-containing protein [Bacteroidota bacterium]MBK6891101.1 T9SS type A sorting domain-containing protein [Sphingobacteriales bacterium]MBK7527072.1 T9SS type A sorting domain-containing protein [Sphingobacteriales bacterium]